MPGQNTSASKASGDKALAEEGFIFDIQRYSIHDGPGIRTIIFLKGCPLRCPWCSNPESQYGARQLWYQEIKCIHCTRCAQSCPREAVKADSGRVLINWNACDNCGLCAAACCSGALDMIGRRITAGQAVRTALADKVFYKDTGGVTLSGGEPLTQARFAEAVLRGCKEAELHTAVETSGCADWEDIARVLPYTDLFLYDIKLMNTEKHKRVIGPGNEKILRNAGDIAAQGIPLVVRVPVVPGINDDEENLAATIRFAEKIGALSVDLLPYHRLGEAKYARLGRAYSLPGVPAPGLDKTAALFANAKIPVKVGG